MADPLPAIADNAAVDEAKFVSEQAQATAKLPPWASLAWVSEEYYSDEDIGTGVGCLRVHVLPGGDGVSISTDLEDKETGLDIGASIQLDREQALDVAQAIVDTVEVQG